MSSAFSRRLAGQKFDQPTVSGVDFPRVAMSDAHWDGTTLHLAAHPQNDSVAGTATTVTVAGLDPHREWEITALEERVPLAVNEGAVTVDLVVDNRPYAIAPR